MRKFDRACRICFHERSPTWSVAEFCGRAVVHGSCATRQLASPQANDTNQRDGNHNIFHKLTSELTCSQSVIFYWLHRSILVRAGGGVHSGMNTRRWGWGSLEVISEVHDHIDGQDKHILFDN